MRAVFAAIETDSCDPFIDKTRVLPGTQVSHVVGPAWKDEIEDCTATALQPDFQTPACLCHDLELNWPASLLLGYRRAVADMAAANDITNLDLHEIAASHIGFRCVVAV